MIENELEDKVSFIEKYGLPIGNIILGFGAGFAHGCWEQQSGMPPYEDPSNAAIFASPLIVALVEHLGLMALKDDINVSGGALLTSYVGMYGSIIAGKYVGRAIGALKDMF